MKFRVDLISSTAMLASVALACSPAVAQTAAKPSPDTSATPVSAPADAAPAQADQGGQVNDIVVTARKRAETLTSVPLSISALDSQRLEARNIKDTIQLSDFTPGFNQRQQVSGVSGLNNRLFNSLVFRGLNLANNTGLTAAGLMFLDGAPVTSGQVEGISDVERVEVLRGPQSAYFGRSTFSGAINYITKAPTEEFSGSAHAEYSSYGSTDDSLTLQGSVIPDLLRVRVTGHHFLKGGEYTNAANTSEKLGKQETNSISGTLYFTPAPNLTIKSYISYFQLRDGAPAQAALKPDQADCGTKTVKPYFCGVVPRVSAANISANNVITPFAYSQLYDNVNGFATPVDPKLYPKIGLGQNTIQTDTIVNYDLNGYTFTSVTAYHDTQTEATADIDYRNSSNVANPYYGILANTTPYIWWLNVAMIRLKDFNQELRVASPTNRRLRFVAGGNYIEGTQVGSNSYGLSPYGTSVFAPTTTLKARTPSVFGGAYFRILPKLTISAEGRYQWDRIEQTTTAAQFNQTFRSFSPRVTLDYAFQPNSTLYVLWSRGYRPGGFNTALNGQPQSVLDQLHQASGAGISYAQERIDNFEAGIKGRFFDGRATASLSAYIGKLSDQQSQSVIQAFQPSGQIQLFTLTDNIGKTNFSGVEFESTVKPVPELTVTGTFAYNHTNIRQFNCIECATYITGSANVRGNRLPGVPEITASVSAVYERQINERYSGYLRGDYIHQGTVFADYSNVAETGDTNRVNLAIGIEDRSKSLELFVRNLTNNLTYQGLTRGVDAITLTYNELRVALADKRTFGLRGSFKF